MMDRDRRGRDMDGGGRGRFVPGAAPYTRDMDARYVQIKAVFLYCYSDYPSCPANAVQMDRATWAT